MYCQCTNTEAVNNSNKCNTPCSDFPLQTCGNMGGQVDSNLTSYSVYLVNGSSSSCSSVATLASYVTSESFISFNSTISNMNTSI